MINTTCHLLRAKINVMTLQYCIESGVSFCLYLPLRREPKQTTENKAKQNKNKKKNKKTKKTKNKKRPKQIRLC